MAMNDVFNSNAFNMVEMTAAVNRTPYKPGFLGSRGLFTASGVTTYTVAIEEKSGVLSLVQSKPRNGPREGKAREKRKIRTFQVPHLPEFDYIRADELIGVRAFGQEQGFVTEQQVRDERLGRMNDNLDITLEHHYLGAVQGLVLDADGSTIHDLYEEFDVSAVAEINMDLGSATEGALNKKCNVIKRTIADELGGRPFTGIEALCGDDFFDDLVANKDVRELYRRAEANKLGDAPAYSSVRYADITWINYRGAGSAKIHTDKVRFYPTGVSGLFTVNYAPAPFFSSVNSVGLPRYARQPPGGDTDVQIDLEVQTNPLVLCNTPRVLLKGKRTA